VEKGGECFGRGCGRGEGGESDFREGCVVKKERGRKRSSNRERKKHRTKPVGANGGEQKDKKTSGLREVKEHVHGTGGREDSLFTLRKRPTKEAERLRSPQSAGEKGGRGGENHKANFKDFGGDGSGQKGGEKSSAEKTQKKKPNLRLLKEKKKR